MVTLKDVSPGQTAIVESVKVSGQARGRFMTMGILRGAKIRVVKVAPLGDPIEVRVKSYSLSLRKAEAEQITVHLE